MYRSCLLCFLLLPVLWLLASCSSNFGVRSKRVMEGVGSNVNDTDDGRIVGGFETSIYEHPYQVSLRYKGFHRCGAAIIAEDWIVTAAHCVKSVSIGLLSIKAGSTTLLGGGGQVLEVRKVVIHEDYSPSSSDSDIALVQLEEPLEFGRKVRPVSLAWEDDWQAGAALVVGWGAQSSNGKASNRLREVVVPLISNKLCSRLYGPRRVTDRMICAGYVGKGGRDACQGDSGGPLLQHGKLIGIVSWGIGCAKPYYPGVYTRLAAFRSWIKDETGI